VRVAGNLDIWVGLPRSQRELSCAAPVIGRRRTRRLAWSSCWWPRLRWRYCGFPTSELLDEHSPALFCTIRNYHDANIKAARVLGGNGYSSNGVVTLMGAGNPYVYPDNLPRVNARRGPEGQPGCWQPITRDLWPSPYLVMDTGASIAPYNHFELGQPILIEYVWGRQIGENTINP
jgi:phospholipid/cholesterol/gamma-HCH transport system substrate-binding protein